MTMMRRRILMLVSTPAAVSFQVPAMMTERTTMTDNVDDDGYVC